MQQLTAAIANTAFIQEVQKGLTSYPKKLSSKYFYDQKGDALFQQIMAMPSYYLTDAEFEILQENVATLAAICSAKTTPFSLYELGAGDGKKTKILLRYLMENQFDFEYRPIDISKNALSKLTNAIAEELPKVTVNPLEGTYFSTLKTIGETSSTKKVILFLGSNIGNMPHQFAADFLLQLQHVMNAGDILILGMDQKKNPQTILNAYNDPEGITAAFNKNILSRINTELEGDFDLDAFLHWETYNPETGTAKSYLVSKKEQVVNLKALDITVSFNAWESIHTEISQKYDDNIVTALAEKAGLQISRSFQDSKGYFKNYVLLK